MSTLFAPPVRSLGRIRCPSRTVMVSFLIGLIGAAWPGTGRAQTTADSPSAQMIYQSTLPTPEQAIPNTIPMNTVTPAAPDNYHIGIDDLLYVYVYEMPEFTRQVRVDSNGNIRLPFLAHPIPAAGVEAGVVASRIEEALASSGLANHPMVSVTVRQIMSQPIVVTGAVRTPLNLQTARPMTLLELIARANGLSNNPPAGMTAIVMNNPPDTSQVSRVNLARLFEGQGPWVSRPIRGGATIMVLQAPLVYAVGALGRPGAFPLRTGEPVSVLKLLSLAEGIKDPAQKNHAEIIHTLPDGTHQIIPVNLDKILEHKAPDPTMAAGDILYVPVNGRQKILTAVLADAGQAAVIAIGYSHF